jgi:transcriptional regulator with XRE-family HTH domain
VKRPSSRLGEIIRRQREFNRLTLRQFAAMTGVSNPYLSQIERGLRTPSADVIDAIARTLKLTLEELYQEAGLDNADQGHDRPRARLEAVLEEDGVLGPRQRRVLLEVYDGLIASTATRPRRRQARASDPERTQNTGRS